VAGNSVTAGSTLPRTGSTPWLQVGLGALLASAGAAMVLMSRRRTGPREGHVFEF
jgi:LPXTG-motif cell wall-anchored protein